MNDQPPKTDHAAKEDVITSVLDRLSKHPLKEPAIPHLKPIRLAAPSLGPVVLPKSRPVMKGEEAVDEAVKPRSIQWNPPPTPINSPARSVPVLDPPAIHKMPAKVIPSPVDGFLPIRNIPRPAEQEVRMPSNNQAPIIAEYPSRPVPMPVEPQLGTRPAGRRPDPVTPLGRGPQQSGGLEPVSGLSEVAGLLKEVVQALKSKGGPMATEQPTTGQLRQVEGFWTPEQDDVETLPTGASPSI